MGAAVERACVRGGIRKPLRLLHVFHSFGCGGAQTRLLRIANHFGPVIEHVIISMNGDYSGMDQITDPDCAEAHPLGVIAKGLFGRISQFECVLEQVRPDRLVTHNWGTIEWALPARRQRVPHIHIEDGFGPDEAYGQKLRRLLARRILLRECEVVVPSRRLQQIALQKWRIAPARLHMIPNGIDCRRYSRTWQWREEPVIGIVAALRSEKNIERLLRAFALVNRKVRSRLIIVGDGPERTRLEQAARDEGILERVSFAGYAADPIPFYHRFNVFALTSDTEQMPYTVLEAMAVGLPIVATDVGDIRVMVATENASLIVGRHDEAVAEALLSVLQDTHRAEKLGKANALKVRAQYDQAAMFLRFAQLYGIPE